MMGRLRRSLYVGSRIEYLFRVGIVVFVWFFRRIEKCWQSKWSTRGYQESEKGGSLFNALLTRYLTCSYLLQCVVV